jgi:hypothetical protein
MRKFWLLLAAVVLATPAGAACRDDLIKADQNFNRTRSDLQKAAAAAPALKCAAYRRHVASLTEVRNVFARCDTGAAKAANARQVSSSLAEFNKQMRESCAGAAKK